MVIFQSISSVPCAMPLAAGRAGFMIQAPSTVDLPLGLLFNTTALVLCPLRLLACNGISNEEVQGRRSLTGGRCAPSHARGPTYIRARGAWALANTGIQDCIRSWPKARHPHPSRCRVAGGKAQFQWQLNTASCSFKAEDFSKRRSPSSADAAVRIVLNLSSRPHHYGHGSPTLSARPPQAQA